MRQMPNSNKISGSLPTKVEQFRSDVRSLVKYTLYKPEIVDLVMEQNQRDLADEILLSEGSAGSKSTEFRIRIIRQALCKPH